MIQLLLAMLQIFAIGVSGLEGEYGEIWYKLSSVMLIGPHTSLEIDECPSTAPSYDIDIHIEDDKYSSLVEGIPDLFLGRGGWEDFMTESLLRKISL